jgi:dCMP deaminase
MVLVLHIPVVHQGYLELLKRHKKEKVLYLLGEELINEFPMIAREVRRVDPKIIASFVEGLAIFDQVVVVGPDELRSLKPTKIVSADEVELRGLIKKYLPKAKVDYDRSFLRWDAKNVEGQKEIEADRKISRKEFDRNVIRQTIKEAEKSSDWYRQVGAAVVKNKKIVLVGYNQRQPAPQTAYIEGDPRNFFPIGTSTHLRSVLHAEQMVITEAAKRGIALRGTDIYTSTFPCPDCANLIANSGFRRCYYAAGYSTLDGEKVLKNHGVELVLVRL